MSATPLTLDDLRLLRALLSVERSNCVVDAVYEEYSETYDRLTVMINHLAGVVEVDYKQLLEDRLDGMVISLDLAIKIARGNSYLTNQDTAKGILALLDADGKETNNV